MFNTRFNKIRRKLAVQFGFLMFVIFISDLVVADELYTLDSKMSRSSDEINLDTLNFEYSSHLRAYFWPYQEKTEKRWDWGVTAQRNSGDANSIPFSANMAKVKFGWHHSQDNYIIAKIGNHSLRSDNNQASKNRNIYELSASLGSDDYGYVYYHFVDDYVYQLSLQPAGIDQFLNAKRHTLGLRLSPSRKIRLEEKVASWNLSDDNVRRSAKFDAFYRLTQNWVWVGLSYEKMGYRNNQAGYWTPLNFRSYGVVFEASVDLQKNFSANLSGNVSKIKEDDFSSGNASSFALGFDYKPVKKMTIRYAFTHLKSQQQSSQWTERAYNVSINGLF